MAKRRKHTKRSHRRSRRGLGGLSMSNFERSLRARSRGWFSGLGLNWKTAALAAVAYVAWRKMNGQPIGFGLDGVVPDFLTPGGAGAPSFTPSPNVQAVTLPYAALF